MPKLVRIVAPFIAALMFVTMVMTSTRALGAPQNSGALMPALPPSFLNASGLVAAAGRLCTTATGTSTPLATYSNAALSSALPNPIVLDSTGRPTTNGSTRASIYLQAASYRITLYSLGTGNTCNGTSVGAQIWQQDNVYDVGLLITSGLVDIVSPDINKIRYCNASTGATAGAKIAACIADLPSTGGVADARGIEGNQTISQNIWDGVSKPVTLLLGAANFTVTVTQSIDCDSCQIIGLGHNGVSTTAGTVFTSSGLTKTFGIASLNLMSDLTITGDSTASATGLFLGDTEIWSGTIERVDVINFTGSNSIGMRLGDVVDSTIIDPRLEGNYINLVLNLVAAGGAPTATRFIGGYIREADTVGARIVSGTGVVFLGTTWESNDEEGVDIDCATSSSNILGITFQSNFWENNWGSTTSEYQMVSTCPVATGTTQMAIRDGWVTQSGSSAKFLNINGAGNNAITIDNVEMTSLANTILLQNSARATCVIPRSLTYSTIVSITTSATCINNEARLDTIEAAWTAWSPTYSSDVGNQAATYSGSVTTTVARYKQVGKTLCVNIVFSGTLNAVTPNSLRATIPLGLGAVASTYNLIPAYITDNGTAEMGVLNVFSVGDGALLSFGRIGGANYTSAGAVVSRFTGCFEVS